MFGVDLTWLGWVWVLLAAAGIVINVLGGLAGNRSKAVDPEVRVFVGLLSILLLVGFFTVGFTHGG